MKFILTFVTVLSFYTSFAQSAIDKLPLTNVATGQAVVLTDFKSAKAVVVIFTSNVCAYDQYYTDRLKALFTNYRSAVQFLLVNSNTEAEETPDKMKSKYDLWSYDVPYLADKDQVWMKALGARKTPEAFVLDPTSNFAVVYSGSIDDNPQLANAVKEPHLKNAIDWAIGGQRPSVPTVRAVGCSMRSK